MGNTQSGESHQPPGSWHSAESQDHKSQNSESESPEIEPLDPGELSELLAKAVDEISRQLNKIWERRDGETFRHPLRRYDGMIDELVFSENPSQHVATAYLMVDYYAQSVTFAKENARLGETLRAYQDLTGQFLQLVRRSKEILLNVKSPEALQHIQRVQIAEAREDDPALVKGMNAVKGLIELRKALMPVVHHFNMNGEKTKTLAEIEKLHAKECILRDNLIAELRKQVETPGSLPFYQAMVAKLDRELSKSRQQEKETESQLKSIREMGKETAPLTREIFMHSDLAKEMQQKMNRMEEDIKKLREDNSKTGDLRREVRGLKEKLKEGHVKDLEGKLRQTRSERDEARAQLKNMNAADTAEPLIHTDSAKEDQTTNASSVNFANGAIETFKHQKTVLREMRKTVAELKDSRGGSGWSIVDRAESMVNYKTALLIQEIDRCLALREVSEVEAEKETERVERLEMDGFPALTDVESGDGDNVDGRRDAGSLLKDKKKGKGKKVI